MLVVPACPGGLEAPTSATNAFSCWSQTTQQVICSGVPGGRPVGRSLHDAQRGCETACRP